MPVSPELQAALDRLGQPSKLESESRMFKILEVLNRPNSAFFGGLSEAIEGRDPFGAVGQALSGEKHFGGRDFLSAAFDVDPKSKLGRRGGLALDVLNPFDPLLLLGFGGLTKVGKAARAGMNIPGAAKLGSTFGQQAKLGQRGLVNIGGHRLPLPGDAAVLDALQRGGKALKETRAGKGVKQVFGGRKGFLETQLPADFNAEDMETFLRAGDIGQRNKNLYGAKSSQFLESVKANLKRNEEDDFLALLDRTGKGAGDLEQNIIKFVGTGPQAARRQKAVRSAMDFFEHRFETSQDFLGGAGAARFMQPEVGYLPRYFHPKKGAADSELRRFFGPKTAKTGRVIKLEGLSDNPMNRSLVMDSELPVSREMLTDAGKKEFDSKGGAPFYEVQRTENPAAHIDFQQRARMRITEQDELARNFEGGIGTFETNPIKLLTHMQDELANSIETNSLIKGLEDAGIAVPWKSITPEDAGKFLKIDQGQWTNNWLGVPAIFGDAFQKYQEVFYPGPDKPIFAEMIKAIFGETAANFGGLSWWKGFSIMGAGPTAFMHRNFWTGVLKNYYEGLGPTSFHGVDQAQRFYREAGTLVSQSLGLGGKARFGQRLDISGGFAKGDALFKLGDGTALSVSRLRIMEDYMAFGVHGGGSPMPEIVEGFENMSTAARQAVFGHFHRGNFRVEMSIRLPLFMKFMEDTFEVARKAGIKMPERIGSRKQTPEIIGDFYDVAVTNGRDAVMRAHFDYSDLTPIERRIRSSIIPFYIWLRKNIPNETINMLQNSGRYMPFAKGYYNAFQQEGITPEDLPEWAQRGFAVPLHPSGDERARWLDFTGFLPFMDVAELGEAAGTGLGLVEPQTGKTRFAEVIRYAATRWNPFPTQIAEQGLQRNFFTGRSFSGDVPETIFGVTRPAHEINLANLLRPVRDIDRLNPLELFGETPRPHRNEPPGVERLTRLLTGVKIRTSDKDEASLSLNRRRARIKRFKSRERRARRDGNEGEAEFYRLKAESLEQGVR